MAGRALIAGVVVVGAQGLGGPSQMDHEVDIAESVAQARAGRKVTGPWLDAGRQRCLAADQRADAVARRREPFQKMTADEAGAACHQSDHCGVLRKATSPK